MRARISPARGLDHQRLSQQPGNLRQRLFVREPEMKTEYGWVLSPPHGPSSSRSGDIAALTEMPGASYESTQGRIRP